MTKCAVSGLVAALMAWAASAPAAELIVSAAASLTNAFTEVGRAFEKANPSHKVVFNFGGSGALLQQIARGAPVDVFASADQDTMDRAAKRNLIVPDSRADFTRNSLVLVAAKGSNASPSSLGELKQAAVKRIAIGNPDTVPAGKYSRQALEAAGLFEVLKDKYINTQNVRQSLDYVARGEVDAGFVYSTDAAMMPDRVKVLLEVPTRTAIAYPIAAVKGSGRESLAIKFVDFVQSETAQKILQKYGFKPLN